MSRRRTKAEEIRNPEHYFKRYIACERKKEQEEDTEYYNLHESLDSMVERASAGYDHSSYRLFSVNLENEEIEDALAKRNLFGWIDQIENPQLHKAAAENDLLLYLCLYKNSVFGFATARHAVTAAISPSGRRFI